MVARAATKMPLLLSMLAAASAPPPPCGGRPWSGPRVSISSSTGGGLGRLAIDGRAVVAQWVKVGGEDPLEGGGADRWTKVQYTLVQAAKVGALPIVSFGTDRMVRNSSGSEGGTDWQFSDATPFDNRTEDLFARILAYAPNALLLPTVWPYFAHHDNGACEVAGQRCESTLLQDATNTSNTKKGYVSAMTLCLVCRRATAVSLCI